MVGKGRGGVQGVVMGCVVGGGGGEVDIAMGVKDTIF